MPLPDAKPKPEGSNIYHQLNAIKLGDLTNAQYDIVYDPLFLNDKSEDELRRLALIGLARQSFSPSSAGPVGSSITVYADITSSGQKVAMWGGGTLDSTNSATDDDAVFPPGTVWLCSGGSWYTSSISGSVNHDVWLAPSSMSPVVESKSTLIVDLSSTGGNQPLFSSETGGLGNIYVDDDTTIYCEGTGTIVAGGDIRYSMHFVRVR